MISCKASAKSGTLLARAWLGLCIALALHVTDEALTGFLSVYNPTVLALRAKYSWFPMPTFRFWTWLLGLSALVFLLLLLTPLFRRNVRWVRPIGYFFGLVNVLNAMGHITGTVLGRTVNSVHFSRPMPGFYSSPFLLAAALYLLSRLRR